MKLSQRKTVSESKITFHNEFQYVIPAVYRRVIDEFIVELNLLRNQSEFLEDHLFSLGLVKSFEDLTEGYKPSSHKDGLIKAICKSTGFDINNIEALSKTIISKSIKLAEEANGQSLESNKKIVEILVEEFKINKKNYYSRITGIGFFIFCSNAFGEQKDDLKPILNLAEEMGFKKERLEKDINLYKNSLDKMKKVMELIDLNIKEEKKRAKRREEGKK
tara:strand:- start:128 stop:784 length:657 start_codon:yes stop_codon:yes gene_type:complete